MSRSWMRTSKSNTTADSKEARPAAGGPYRRPVLVAALVFVSLLVTGPAASAAPGDLDPTFDGDGKLEVSLGDWTFGGELASQPDGGTVVSGSVCDYVGDPYSGEVDCSDFARRYAADGSLDTSFGDEGKTAPLPGSIADLTVLPDGKILAAGGTADGDFFLTRYEADGTPDTGFGDGGKVVTDFGDDRVSAVSLTLLPDGKMVVAGQAQGTERERVALARYMPDGSLDDGFGSAGKEIFDPGIDININDLLSLPDGKSVAAGSCVCRPGNPAPALMRFNEDGSQDKSFGRDGVASIGLDDRYNYGAVEDVAVRSDGKLVAAGDYRGGTSAQAQATLLRFNADGSLDASFGEGGKATMGHVGSADALAIQPNGKIVTGVIRDEYAFSLERYKGNGVPDVGFGEDGGMRPIPFGMPANALADLVIRPDGKMVIGGSVGSCSRTCSYDLVMARFDGGDNSRSTARDDRANTQGNRRAVLNVLRNDSDPDGDRLTVARHTRSKHGTVRCADAGRCVYVRDRGYSGRDAFEYVAEDGSGGVDRATVRIRVGHG